VNLTSGVEGNKGLVVDPVVEGAGSEAVRDNISAVRMGDGQDVRGVQQAKLHAAERALVPIGR